MTRIPFSEKGPTFRKWSKAKRHQISWVPETRFTKASESHVSSRRHWHSVQMSWLCQPLIAKLCWELEPRTRGSRTKGTLWSRDRLKFTFLFGDSKLQMFCSKAHMCRLPHDTAFYTQLTPSSAPFAYLCMAWGERVWSVSVSLCVCQSMCVCVCAQAQAHAHTNVHVWGRNTQHCDCVHTRERGRETEPI